MFIDKAEKIGPHTHQYIKKLFDQNGVAETKYKTAMGIIQLKKQYETKRIEKAVQLAMLYPIASYNKLKGILEKNLDLHDDLFDNIDKEQSHIPDHENIRGAEYYEILSNQNRNYYATNN